MKILLFLLTLFTIQPSFSIIMECDDVRGMQLIGGSQQYFCRHFEDDELSDYYTYGILLDGIGPGISIIELVYEENDRGKFYVNCPFSNEPNGIYYGVRASLGQYKVGYCEGAACIGSQGVCFIGGTVKGVSFPTDSRRHKCTIRSRAGGFGMMLGKFEIFEVFE